MTGLNEHDPPADVESRVEAYSVGADLGWVAAALSARRDEVLSRWFEAAASQPFHQGRRERAVADDIPALVDALIDLLRRESPRWVESSAPLADPAIQSAAQQPARKRAEQRLEPAEVLVEFRLLRQEIWRALRIHLPDGVPTGDVVAAELLVNDALDGAMGVGLTALVERVEQLREEFLATTVHELRQPITVINGTAQLLNRLVSRSSPDLGRVRDQLQVIRATTERIAAQLILLTESSRVALGSLDLNRSSVDLVVILRTAIAQSGPGAAERTAVQVPPDFDPIGVWDPLRLDQVITKLLSNAKK
jgi:signal transduction histidine kinase